ncbi:hypothetical protein UlMin_029304 [Ulmus minor]
MIKITTNIKSSLSKLALLEVILFDVDGTLCDSNPLHYYAFREMLQEVSFDGGVPIDEDFFVENIAGKPNDDIPCFAGKLHLSTIISHSNGRLYNFLYGYNILALEQLKPISGLYKLKKWIEDRGMKRAAVTNAPRPNVSVSGIKDGVATGMPVVGLSTRNPEYLLMEAKPIFLIKGLIILP